MKKAVREAFETGKLSTERKDAEKLGIAGWAEARGVELVDEKDISGNNQQIIICMPVGSSTPFDDNLTGHCIECAGGVIFRPSVGVETAKLCMPCAMKMMADTTED